MPGNRTARSDAQQQLVPKTDDDTASSSSPSHRFPQYDLPLPGTIPTTEGASLPPPGAPGRVMDETGASYHALSSGSYTGPLGPAPAPELRAGPSALGTEASPMPLPATLPAHSPRPGQADLRVGGGASNGGSSVLAAMEIQETLLPPQSPPDFQHPIPLGQRRWMVAMFCVVAALLFADQNLLAPNLTAAAEYFGMDDRQKDVLLGGMLMAAFFAVGAPAALVVGWLTDRGSINRRSLLFWVVVVGETPCLLTYWVTAYWQFFLLRALTGVAVGGCFPLVFSLLGDLFPPKRRAAVSAVVQISTGLGIAVGQALSGSIGPATNWRIPFVVVAAPSLAVAVLMLLTTQEPPRGAFEEALRERFAEGQGAYQERISWAKVAVLLRCPSNVLIICQGLPGSLPWGMVLTYFNDFLSQQKGFTVQAATLVLLMFGGGGALGVIGGGAGGQWLYNRRKEYQALLAGGCVLAGIGPLYALVNADLQRIGLGPTCVLAALGGAVASVGGPNLRAVMLNVNEPETRGVALALQSMTDDLGKGLGPALVAGLIRVMGREDAFNVAAAGWIPCGIMLASLACFMRRDEAAMQARLAKANEEHAAAVEAAASRGQGVTVPMPPLSSAAADGDATAAVGSTTTAAAAASTYDVRREERRLAKVRLLAETGSSDALAQAVGSNGGVPLTATTAGSWWPGRANGVGSSKSVRAVGAPAGAVTRVGSGYDVPGAEAECPLPVSSSAAEDAGDGTSRPWERTGGRGAAPAGTARWEYSCEAPVNDGTGGDRGDGGAPRDIPGVVPQAVANAAAPAMAAGASAGEEPLQAGTGMQATSATAAPASIAAAAKANGGLQSAPAYANGGPGLNDYQHHHSNSNLYRGPDQHASELLPVPSPAPDSVQTGQAPGPGWGPGVPTPAAVNVPAVPPPRSLGPEAGAHDGLGRHGSASQAGTSARAGTAAGAVKQHLQPTQPASSRQPPQEQGVQGPPSEAAASSHHLGNGYPATVAAPTAAAAAATATDPRSDERAGTTWPPQQACGEPLLYPGYLTPSQPYELREWNPPRDPPPAAGRRDIPCPDTDLGASANLDPGGPASPHTAGGSRGLPQLAPDMLGPGPGRVPGL